MAVRRRVKGRFVSEGGADAGSGGPPGAKASQKMLRPKQCREFTRRRMAEALPEILDRFVREAKLGSIPHTKALVNMSGLDRAETSIPRKRAKRRGPGLGELLMMELKRGREAEEKRSGEVSANENVVMAGM